LRHRKALMLMLMLMLMLRAKFGRDGGGFVARAQCSDG
jgi:hypothetical protein